MVSPAAAPAAVPGASAPAPSWFLLGPAWDFLFLGPGVTLLVSAVFFALIAAGQTGAAASLALSLSILFVGPHYAATYRRAYFSREIIRAHPLVTIAAPLALAAAAIAALRFPTTVAPFYFLIYVAWSGYHYSGQSLGLAMIYPLRQGARLAPDEKRLLALPLHVSWLVSLLGLLRVDASARNPAYQSVRQLFAGAWLPSWALGLGLVALLASFASVAVLAARRRRRGTPLPWPTFAVVAAQTLWFGWALWSPFFNIMLVPVFHGLQYLALTSWHHARERRAAGGAGASPRAFAVYVVTVIALGLVINPGLFALAGRALGDAATVSATVITFVNLHHFLLDGRIWRMREPQVARSFSAGA